MRRLCFAVTVAVLGLVLGCDETGDNYLKGSLTESHDMDFERTRARLYVASGSLAIEYVAKDEKIALRITLYGDAKKGGKYDLMTQGTVNRGEGFGSPLPELESGDLELTEYSPQDGGEVAGSFEALFVTMEGNKKTLRGGFSADLEVVD